MRRPIDLDGKLRFGLRKVERQPLRGLVLKGAIPSSSTQCATATTVSIQGDREQIEKVLKTPKMKSRDQAIASERTK